MKGCRALCMRVPIVEGQVRVQALGKAWVVPHKLSRSASAAQWMTANADVQRQAR
jgi:hypothetical protein